MSNDDALEKLQKRVLLLLICYNSCAQTTAAKPLSACIGEAKPLSACVNWASDICNRLVFDYRPAK